MVGIIRMDHKQLLTDSPLDLAKLIQSPKNIPLVINPLIPRDYTESTVALKEVHKLYNLMSFWFYAIC